MGDDHRKSACFSTVAKQVFTSCTDYAKLSGSLMGPNVNSPMEWVFPTNRLKVMAVVVRDQMAGFPYEHRQQLANCTCVGFHGLSTQMAANKTRHRVLGIRWVKREGDV
jgi:hypothetical protein